jgi:hypothetical protein
MAGEGLTRLSIDGSPARREGDRAQTERLRLIEHINLQLAAMGQPAFKGGLETEFLAIADELLQNYALHKRLLIDHRCPSDTRIESFLGSFLREHELDASVRLPGVTLVLDRPGMAHELSLPPDGNIFESAYIQSYRVEQGMLHNPRNDRRTTEGVFHIAEGGPLIPADKKAVPPPAFQKLLIDALNPPSALLKLPFTSSQKRQAEAWVSLHLRPAVCPGVGSIANRMTMETRFFAPGGLVANLDFVERIFGNAGDPFLPENDAALDVEHWSGQTGCVILAPQLVRLKKIDLGLPNVAQATPRQRRDGMCWSEEGEIYNDGKPFKLVCRDFNGVIVTIIADNYFGYSKKEIKSQISYAASVFGGAEEEHAGGALALPTFNLGEVYQAERRHLEGAVAFDHTIKALGANAISKEGYATDRTYGDIVYIPEDSRIDLRSRSITWGGTGAERTLRLLAGHDYVYPTGFRVRMEKHPNAPSWRLVGTSAEGVMCHKPCTVSGGGKSEISKSIAGSILAGPLFVGDFDSDLDEVERIVNRDYSDRFRDPSLLGSDARPLLSRDRSLGSVIKLLTPSDTDYTAEYNQWLETIPQHIRALVFVIKRFYRTHWGNDWRSRFSVDIVNGYPGNELRFEGRKLVASYLRVGRELDGAWRIFKLRQDYMPADKVQLEDDITVSVTLPGRSLADRGKYDAGKSYKFVENCENMLFQRPDDAVCRGLDRQAEADLAEPGNFITNFEPLTPQDAREIMDDAIGFDAYTQPMRDLIRKAAGGRLNSYFVASSHPRIIDGKPSPNVRYLQQRPDTTNARERHLAEVGVRLAHGFGPDLPVQFPVGAVLSGRRNNPGDPARGIRPLSVYSPIHYQELPELFMDYIASLTGKSPSTTGAGSEGAMTKGPFNALPATVDLNNALVSMVLCGHHGFSTAAGHVGKNRRVDHDISYLVPEIWCRLKEKERDPQYLISRGFLERLEDYNFNGRLVAVSRLGYRITKEFVHHYFGRVFDSPTVVFDDAMLRPETQDPEAFAEGVANVVAAQQRVAQAYLDDGTVESAAPPVKALLYIMATGRFEGRGVEDPGVRAMFTRDYLLSSDWYRARLGAKQQRDVALWQRHVDYLERHVAVGSHLEEDMHAVLAQRLILAKSHLSAVAKPSYVQALEGGLGADPSLFAVR